MIAYLRKKIKVHIAQRYWNSRENFPYFNGKIFFPKGSIIFKRTILEGVYESENISIINHLIEPFTTVFDIGANIGLIAIPILHHNPSIKLISVEASPNTLPYLLKTNKQHPEKNRWDIIGEAVSDKQGTVTFQLADLANGAYESLKDTKRINFKDTVEINCTTIDNIWENAGYPDVSLIKIDIEGADLLALKGGKDCIEKCKPNILMEWNQTNIIPFNLSNKDLLNFAKEFNYIIYCLPYFNRLNSMNELNLFGKLTENFLLIQDEH